MRTTLTLEPDVARALEQMRKQRGLTLKRAVNEALRKGLEVARRPAAARKRFRTKTADHGPPLVGNLDDIAGVLALVEGEGFK
jgi:hypothetical protein